MVILLKFKEINDYLLFIIKKLKYVNILYYFILFFLLSYISLHIKNNISQIFTKKIIQKNIIQV